jgi:hypothetical protein
MDETNIIPIADLNNEQNQNNIQIQPELQPESQPQVLSSPKRKLPPPLNMPLKGNDKRKESCKKVGGEKKRTGHDIEIEFLKQYNNPEYLKHEEAKKEGKSLIEYGATSDTTIDESHPIRSILKDTLNIIGMNVTNKSGKNLQFSLGKIPEFQQIQDATQINSEFVSNLLCNYLKKSNSIKPADILVYKYTSKKKWIFFNIMHVIDYIVEKGKWRKLESGRYKCDFTDGTKKGYSQYITYEYRDTHKSYFLGANCGKGINLINLLMDETYGIKYHTEDFQF